MKSWLRVSVVLLPLLLVFPAAILSQQTKPDVNSRLVMMSVTIQNRNGEGLKGLTREMFQVSDGGQVRPIVVFENTEGPFSIGILIDTSASMQVFEKRNAKRAESLVEAATNLLQQGNAGNEYFLEAFDSAPRILADWKSGSDLLAQKTDLFQVKAYTAFYDALAMALDKLSGARYSRRALFVISDGADNISQLPFKKLRDRLRNSDITVYAIGMKQGEYVPHLNPMTSPVINPTWDVDGQNILSDIAATTGGEVFFPENKEEWNKAINRIADDLRYSYRIGFQADPATQPNKFHRLKVSVKAPPNNSPQIDRLTVRAREGYYE